MRIEASTLTSAKITRRSMPIHILIPLHVSLASKVKFGFLMEYLYHTSCLLSRSFNDFLYFLAVTYNVVMLRRAPRMVSDRGSHKCLQKDELAEPLTMALMITP